MSVCGGGGGGSGRARVVTLILDSGDAVNVYSRVEDRHPVHAVGGGQIRHFLHGV